MKPFPEALLAKLEEQLASAKTENSDPRSYAAEAIPLCMAAVEKLKTHCASYNFENHDDEIEFFRNVKPQFAAKLIYYHEMYSTASYSPVGSKKAIRSYYNERLSKLESWFDENREFYHYYRTGNNCLDHKYFVRGNYDLRLSPDPSYHLADQRFSTSHDAMVSRILANEKIMPFLKEEIVRRCERHDSPASLAIPKTPNWTASKAALIELAYALHAAGVFNNGSYELKDVVAFFERTFGVDLGQFHRTFFDLRSRKADRTKFLNVLTERLIFRMDNADER
jgi:hypothetical protein